MQLFELKKKRHEVATAIEGILKTATKENRALSESDLKALAGHRYALVELDDAIAPIAELNTLSTQFPRGVIPANGHAQPGKAPAQRLNDNAIGNRRMSLQEAMQFATPEQREEANAFARYIGGDMTALADLTPSGDGGVFIPEFVAGVVARNYAAFTPVHDNCYVWPTVDGVPTRFPVISDSEDATILVPAALTGADSVVSGDTPPTEVTGPLMGAHKFSSKPVFVPRETSTDTGLSILEEVLNALLARILRFQNKKYTKGTGTGEPTGFLTDATAYNAGATSTVLDLDIALDLAYSVPQMYRPNGIYMASDTTIKYLRKLKTGIASDKRYLWKEVFEEGNATLGTPARLHGYPIFVNNDMDSVDSDGTFQTRSPLVFGDFKRFVVRDADQGSPFVYRYQVPAKDGNAVIAFQRSDSKLIIPTAISKLVVS